MSVGTRCLPESILPIAAIVLCCLSLAAGDALLKWSSAELSLWQIFLCRSILVVLILAATRLWAKSPAIWIPRCPGWTGIRSALLVAMWVIYCAALPHIQLSVAAAVLYTTPLVITLLSGMLGADSVTRRSWLVVAAGFLGVLLIVKPDASEFNGYQLLPLLSSFLYALAMVLTRVHLKDESTTVLTLWLNLGFVLVAAAVSLGFFLWPAETSSPNGFLTKQWQPLHFREIVIMIALAMTFLMGNLLAAYAYQRGPAPTIAVYDYTYLVFATMFGVVVFTEYPDGLTVLGMLIITVSGIWAIRGNRNG